MGDYAKLYRHPKRVYRWFRQAALSIFVFVFSGYNDVKAACVQIILAVEPNPTLDAVFVHIDKCAAYYQYPLVRLTKVPFLGIKKGCASAGLRQKNTRLASIKVSDGEANGTLLPIDTYGERGNHNFLPYNARVSFPNIGDGAVNSNGFAVMNGRGDMSDAKFGAMDRKVLLAGNFLLLDHQIGLSPRNEHLPTSDYSLSSSSSDAHPSGFISSNKNDNLQKSSDDDSSSQAGEPESIIREPIGRVLGFLGGLVVFGSIGGYFLWRWR